MKIHTTLTINGKETPIELSQPPGAGGGNFHIMIEHYYHGKIILQQGKWNVYTNGKSPITEDQKKFLAQIVTEKTLA